MSETTNNNDSNSPILNDNGNNEGKLEKNEYIKTTPTIDKNENIINLDNSKENIEMSTNTEKVSDDTDNNNTVKEEEEEKNESDVEELEIQYPSPKPSHVYSYNISNLSNNREDLGAGFRSRLKNLNSPTKNTSSSSSSSSTSYSYTYNNNNVNPHTIPSIKIKDDIKIPKNNYSSSYETSSSIPKPSTSTEESSIPKPTPTSSSSSPSSSNNNNNTNNNINNKNHYNDSSTSSAASGKQEATNEEEKEEENKHMFECNICLDTASDPVVTMCGHFYCWPCIAMWLERSNQCPVCKSGISKEKIIPVYARGAERKDPREKDIPHRPAGHREEPEPRRSPFNFEASFSSLFFPFPGFSFTFTNGGGTQFNQGGFFNNQNQQQQPVNRNQNQQQPDLQNYIIIGLVFFALFSIISSFIPYI